MWIGFDRTTHRPFHSLFKSRTIAFLLLGLILFVSFLLIRQNPSQSEIKTLEIPQRLPQGLPTFSVKFNPSLYHTNGTEVIYQIPSRPKAVLFIAHGCTIHAYDFWDKSPNCPHCTGLPEERIFVLQALEQNMAVSIISSLGECWTFGKVMGNVE
jgi:hypothetical protein